MRAWPPRKSSKDRIGGMTVLRKLRRDSTKVVEDMAIVCTGV